LKHALPFCSITANVQTKKDSKRRGVYNLLEGKLTLRAFSFGMSMGYGGDSRYIRISNHSYKKDDIERNISTIYYKKIGSTKNITVGEFKKCMPKDLFELYYPSK